MAAIKDLLRRIAPVRLRRLRSEALHAIRNDTDHHERIERRDFFRRTFRALAFNGISGDYAEFGCCGGQTFGLAFGAIRSAGVPRTLWAFDSFRGLPAQAGQEDVHPAWVAGEMAISRQEFRDVCRSFRIPEDQYRMVEGFYEETLTNVDLHQQDRPQKIAVAYIDCDLYSSTRTVLNFLEPRLRHGMILAFDDYYCWSETAVSGERNACNEFFADHPRYGLVPHLQFGWHGASFIVEDKGLLRAPLARDGKAHLQRAQ